MPRSRIMTFSVIGGVVAVFFLYAFWPRPILVDTADVIQGRMMVTIEEEAKARVRDVYVVSTPAAGRLLRVDVDPGDLVTEDESIVARMLPTNPSVLDVRTEEQASAAVAAAEAALELAKADAARADADLALARTRRDRYVTLVADEAASQAALDQAERDLRAAAAAARSARAAIGMRDADLRSARAMLTDFVGPEGDVDDAELQPDQSIPIHAPVSGVVLKVVNESETTLPVGAEIMRLGDPTADLEIVAELLSPEAVRVRSGDAVLIERWGGEGTLNGVVERVEPWAFTKVSALGVEEQRANVIIRLDCEQAEHAGLGHGYRVHVRIIVWEREDAVIAPANALFRHGGDWAAFVVEGGRARIRTLSIGRGNGRETEILDGVSPGETLVLYPSDALEDGASVRRRG